MKVILIFVLFSISYLASSQSSAEMGVAAIGYVVSDINTSEKFYTEIIGMVPAGGFSLDQEWSKDAGVANSRPFSVKMFKMKNAPTATILKLAYFDKVDQRPLLKSLDATAGVNYLTINYEDLDPVIDRIKQNGIEILGWVKRSNYQLIFIQDPDGIFVELVGPPGP